MCEHFIKIYKYSLSDPKVRCITTTKFILVTRKNTTSSMLHHVNVCKQNPNRVRYVDQQTMSCEGDNDMSNIGTAHKFD